MRLKDKVKTTVTHKIKKTQLTLLESDVEAVKTIICISKDMKFE